MTDSELSTYLAKLSTSERLNDEESEAVQLASEIIGRKRSLKQELKSTLSEMEELIGRL